MASIKEKITLSKEVLSALPKTSEENIKHYISEANIIFAEYNSLSLELIEEMKQRVINFENSTKSEPVNLVQFDDLDRAFVLSNSLNTAYEKLSLDRIFYDLDNFNKANLEKTNELLFNLIEIFRKAGIELNGDDFFYDLWANEYMKLVLTTANGEKINEVLKPKFEELYWKNPNLIRDIRLNFLSLYYKNKKLFEKYIAQLQTEINKDMNQIKKDYHDRIKLNAQNINSNKEFQVKRFTEGELKISDFSKVNISKTAGELIKGDFSSYAMIIQNFNDNLKEYQNYLNYKAIIDKVVETAKAETPKARKENKLKKMLKIDDSESSKKISEIFKKESKLKKSFKSNKADDETIKEIDNLFKEQRSIYHKEALTKAINSESKILDIIYLFFSYYDYYLVLSKELEVEEIKTAGDKEKFKEIYLSPYLNLLNNLDALKDYDIESIILDKAKLDNLKIEYTELDSSSIEDLLIKTNKMCDYYNILGFQDLKLEEIEAYVNYKSILNSLV